MHFGALRMANWSVHIALLLATIVVGVCSPGCGHATHAENGAKPRPAEPETLRAAVLVMEPTSWPAVVRTQGSLIADEVSVVGAKAAGRVREVTFDLGDMVRGQDMLAVLDQDDFRLQVSLAEAQLLQSRAALGLGPSDPVESLDPEQSPPVREAKAVWDETKARVARLRQLQQFARNTVTQEEVDQGVAAEKAAEARHAAAVNAVREKIAQISVRASELSVARQRLADTVVYAPFAGLVQERHVSHGSFVQVGDALFTLVRTSVVRFRGTMPERHAHRLAAGQQVTIKIEGSDEPRISKITRISPSVEEMSRSLAFEVLVDNRDGALRTGMFGEADVVIDPKAQALVVPRSAVTEFAGAEKVWKVVSGMAKEQIVRTGRRGQWGVEIIAGLGAGDEILADAVQGRVARIEPIYQSVTPASAGPADPAEATAGEEAPEPTVETSAPADLTHVHAVVR